MVELAHHLGGADAESLGAPLRDRLLEKQERDPAQPRTVGSWSPAGDAWGRAGGRLLVTSLSLLALEAPYRHVPLWLGTAADGRVGP